MALWVNDGLNVALRHVLGIQAGIGLQCHLYQNNLVPVLTSVLADFTDVVLPGYAAITLNPLNWVGGVAGGLGSYAYPPIVWTFGAYVGPLQTVYGYYILDTVSGKLLVAEAFAVPFPVPLRGGQLTLVLNPLDENI